MRLTGRRLAFAAAILAAALASLGLGLVIQLQPWGADASTAVDDIAEAVAAIVAAAACAVAALQSTGRRRVAWSLMAASAAAWGVGEVIWSVYEVGLRVEVPYPSLADVGFLLAVPPAFAGIVAFWRPGHAMLGLPRLVLEGVIVFMALLYTGWALGLRSVVLASGPPVEHVLNIAYPLGDIAIGTVLILGIRRATYSQRARMTLLLTGLACNAVADSAFSYLNANGVYTVHGSVLDTGWFAGYLLIALSAAWPAQARTDQVDRSPYDLWQIAIPWLAVLTSGATAVVLGVTGRGLDSFLAVMTGMGAVTLSLNMILAQADSFAALRATQRSEATLAEVIAEAPAGVVRLAPDLHILDTNPRFLALVQAHRQDAEGSMITHFLPAGEAVKFAEKMQVLSGGESDAVDGDSEARRSDGTSVWVHWSATAVPRPDGRIEYFIAMFEDTTARHAAEAAAAENLELMQRLSRVKTEFLQSVSHEFKTALIGIQGFSEFMRDTDQLDVNDARAFAADIHRDAERLDRMVTEMLDVDRSETERASIRVVALDINAVIRREVASVEKTAVTPIDTNLADGLPLVLGDSERLGEAISTLLKNAVNHSPEGGRVTISTSPVEEGLVTVSVADQGLGARLDFDRPLFQQDDIYADSPIRKVVGTGLGLGIVRQLVELHGGRLWMESPPGGGRIFHFTLRAGSPKHAHADGLVA